MRPLEPAVSAPPPTPVDRARPPIVEPSRAVASATPRCELCGGTPDLLFRVEADPMRPAVDEVWGLHWCARCQLGAIWPRPTAEEVASFYAVEDYYTHGGDSGWKPQSKSFADRVRVHLAWRADRGVESSARELRSRFDAVEPTLCEIGCGSGSDLAAYAGVGFRTLGVEPDAAARAAARERGLEVVAGTLEELPRELADRRFDLLVVNHVLEHALDVHRSIANLRGLLAPGGQLEVEVPNHACLGFRRSGSAWAFTDAPRHLNFFTPESLANVFAGHGFRITRTRFRGYCRQFSNEWIEAERGNRRALTPGDRRTGSLAARLDAWVLLARTFAAAPERKYDSVRLTLEPS